MLQPPAHGLPFSATCPIYILHSVGLPTTYYPDFSVYSRERSPESQELAENARRSCLPAPAPRPPSITPGASSSDHGAVSDAWKSFLDLRDFQNSASGQRLLIRVPQIGGVATPLRPPYSQPSSHGRNPEANPISPGFRSGSKGLAQAPSRLTATVFSRLSSRIERPRIGFVS
jgi:hypothetical protein